jgi:hypothetical protein
VGTSLLLTVRLALVAPVHGPSPPAHSTPRHTHLHTHIHTHDARQVLPGRDLTLLAPVAFELGLPHVYPLVPPVALCVTDSADARAAQCISGAVVELPLLRKNLASWSRSCECATTACTLWLPVIRVSAACSAVWHGRRRVRCLSSFVGVRCIGLPRGHVTPFANGVQYSYLSPP